MKRTNLFIALLVVVIACLLLMGQAKPIAGPFTNTLLKGWVFAPSQSICGQRAWGTTGSADTLVVSGVDTTCLVFLSNKTAITGHLRYDIRAAGDTIFVTSDSSETASTDKYSYLIIRNAYGARD